MLLHTLAGAFSGGVSGAAGAAVSASAAPLMNQLQDGMASSLQTAGLSSDVAKGIASGIAGLTAAGVGAAVGGTQGAAAAFTVDANNRQLHEAERKAIAQAAMGNKDREDKLKKAACYEIKCWAEFPVGSKERDQNYVSPLEATNLTSEIAWVNAQKSGAGLFGYSATDAALDAFKAGSWQPIKSGTQLVGGSLATVTGTSICSTTGVGCIVGGPLVAFGASEAIQGGTGLYNYAMGNTPSSFNPLRSGLNYMSPTWGDTAYDATFLLLTGLTLGATVPLKVGASDGINRANSMFGVTVPRWQNPIVNPVTNNIVLPQMAAQGTLLYGVGSRVPVLVEDIKTRGEKNELAEDMHRGTDVSHYWRLYGRRNNLGSLGRWSE